MSLLTRTILILSLVVLSVAIAAGLMLHADSSPSGIDRFVAARNHNEAVAYQTAKLVGGRVAKAGGMISANMGDKLLADDQRPGSDVQLKDSQLARDTARAAAELQAARDEIVKLALDDAGIATLNDRVTQARAGLRKTTADFSKIEGTLSSLAVTLESYSASISRYFQLALNLDFEVQAVLADITPLRLEAAQINADTARIELNARGLETEVDRLQAQFNRAAQTLADYEKRMPSLRYEASVAGKPWLRGAVTQASTDILSGFVWINLGEVDGVRPGQRFAIHRDGRFIAHMRIESVGPDRAEGRLEEGFRGAVKVAVNDSVRAAAHIMR
jgi:hypothetical protein